MSKTITLTDEQGAALQSGEPVTIEPAKKVGPDAELFAWLDRQADAREAMELAEAQRQSDECQRDLFDSTPAQSEHDEERIVSRLFLTADSDGSYRQMTSDNPDATEYVRTDLTGVRQIYALADIRAAIGDAHGKLMLDEVIARVQTMAERPAELERELARRDARVAADALEDSANVCSAVGDAATAKWLRIRADSFRREAEEGE